MPTFDLPGHPGVKISTRLMHAENIFLGCHTKCIAALGLDNYNITAGLPALPASAKAGLMLVGDEAKQFLDYLRTDKEARNLLFRDLEVRCSHVSLVFMSCPCNTDDNKPSWTGNSHGALSIADFAGWLREQGEYIIGSPLVTNSNHQTSSFSLLRGWIWVPTHIYRYVKHIEGTEYVSGKMKSGLPFDEWVKHYAAFHEKNPLYSVSQNGNKTKLAKFKVEELLG